MDSVVVGCHESPSASFPDTFNQNRDILTPRVRRLDRNYLTRRIRRRVQGPDINAVLEKQITIPLILPWDLENYILTNIPHQHPDLPSHITRHPPLIPVHDTFKYDSTQGILPTLRDIVSEKGNLRYWVITNESMWAGQHRALDEIAEVLWSFFYWFKQTQNPTDLNTDSEECVWHLARFCRRNIVLPQVPTDNALFPTNRIKAGLPSLRESLLFRPWVIQSPAPGRDFAGAEESHGPHRLFDEDAVLYPFPDDLFWTEGDEGEWEGDGAPPWREVDV